MTPHCHQFNPMLWLTLSRLSQVESVAASKYIKMQLNVWSIYSNSDQLFIIFQMVTIGFYVMEEITSKVYLFCSIMKQNVILNKFNREYAPLTTIQSYAASEVRVSNSNELCLNLTNSSMHMLVKITKTNGTNIDEITAAFINLLLYSMLREIWVTLINQNEKTRASCTRTAQS